MKLRNTSRFSGDLVRWALALAREVLIGDQLSMAGVAVWVRNKGRSFSGRAYGRSRRVVASVGPDASFPLTYTYRRGVPDQRLVDATECLCSILAHELQHLVQHRDRMPADEVQCELVSARAVKLCRERRAAEAVVVPVDPRIAAMAAGRARAAEARRERDERVCAKVAAMAAGRARAAEQRKIKEAS